MKCKQKGFESTKAAAWAARAERALYSPVFWGAGFLLVIPIFAFIYFLLPAGSVSHPDELTSHLSLFDSLYFSIITITTLGYGDLSPVSVGAKVAVISEALTGVVAIGFFLNAVAYTRSKSDAEKDMAAAKETYRNLELHKLQRQHEIVRELLIEYIYLAVALTKPMEQRGNIKEYDPDFDFHNLSDIYQPSLLRYAPILEPAIQSFYRAQNALASRLEKLQYSIDLTLWKNLDGHIATLLRNFRQYDSEQMLLGYLNMTMDGKSAREVMSKLVKEWKGEVKYYPSNSINGFVTLFNLLRVSIPTAHNILTALSEILDITEHSALRSADSHKP